MTTTVGYPHPPVQPHLELGSSSMPTLSIVATPDLLPYSALPDQPCSAREQVTLLNYILAGACAILIWDSLDTIREDYKLVTKHTIRLPTVVYFICRFSTLAFAISHLVFSTEAVTTDCYRFALIVFVFYPIAIPSASLLFFFRLRAVFFGNRLVTIIFGLLWFCELGASLMYPLSFWLGFTQSDNIDPGSTIGSACLPHFNRSAGNVLLFPVTVTFLYDTMVLIAISWRLTKNTHQSQDFRNGVQTFFLGKYLPAFSRAILQDNQLYYLATVPLTMLMLAQFATLSRISSIPFHLLVVIPSTALTNIMACRVYRNTKINHKGLKESGITTSNIVVMVTEWTTTE